ncbi:MAG: tripartite tricarboxylate transporter TctB family protein [Spirochaetia bacterium]|jgi:hypothetical protein|nr:tripartite tricarboxylate transporter TctB family protein [Spirochaetia bacterium]
MKNSDRYVSIILLAIAGLWTYLTFQIKANSLPGAPGPRFFPLVIIAVLALLALQLLLSSFKKGAVSKPVAAKKQDIKMADIVASQSTASAPREGVCEEFEEPKPVPMKMLYSFVAIFAYVVLSGLIGFYVATVPFVFVIIKLIMGTKSWPKSIIATVAITGAVYLIFTVFFKLSLPSGSLWY